MIFVWKHHLIISPKNPQSMNFYFHSIGPKCGPTNTLNIQNNKSERTPNYKIHLFSGNYILVSLKSTIELTKMSNSKQFSLFLWRPQTFNIFLFDVSILIGLTLTFCGGRACFYSNFFVFLLCHLHHSLVRLNSERIHTTNDNKLVKHERGRPMIACVCI